MDNIHEIVELAWKDSVSFSDIYKQYGISEKQVKTIMRKNLKKGSYYAWRKRVQGRHSVHYSE